MQTNELKQKITEVFMSFEEFPEANTELFVDDILDLFKKEYEENLRWIPVEERLPEKYQNVLLKEDSGSIYVGFYGGNSKLPICRATESRLIAITHWRPISFL